MIRVLVADDHVVVRRGVMQILAEDPEIEVVSQAGSGQQVLKAMQEHEYEVVLLDIAMPDGSGLDVLEELHNKGTRPHILMLSMYPEKQYALHALKLGADGYLTKDSLPEELLEAIHVVAGGGKYINQKLAEQLFDEVAGLSVDTSLKNLTRREIQVVKLLASGLGITEISNKLALSVSSVSTYRGRVLKKLGLKNTAELIRYAIQNKLIE